MKDEDIAQLIQQESFLNYCFRRNEEDTQYWENWLNSHPESAEEVIALREQLILMAQASEEKVKQHHYAELQEKITGSQVPAKRRILPMPLWSRIAAAASVVLLLAAGTYWLMHKKQVPRQVVKAAVQDIRPGGNKAVLTLSGGKQVVLTGAANGTVAQQGSMVISKTDEGKIAYTGAGDQAEAGAMNTITTPRGGKWFVTLSDGTKVWLNAASSITYPVAFTGKERKVTITGEAYFEVMHHAAQPFTVIANGQTVEDIGTAFNINAYSDEPDTKTTLVEGIVKVSTKAGSSVLKPGQQAQSVGDLNLKVVRDDDIEQTVAWKNDLFIFNRTDLHTLMRELSRWYDVDVVYENGVKNDVFFGKIRRDNSLSQILKVLELGDVHFRIEDRKLIIMP